jgi:hypothetical protein
VSGLSLVDMPSNACFYGGVVRSAVTDVLTQGEIIADYPDDQPYPSRLLLGFTGGKPLHVVVAFDRNSGLCIVVTTYVPLPSQWERDFRTRKTR